jgi:hypothetical protein
MTLLTQRYAGKIRGQLSCYDRLVIQGTLPGLCYAQGMSAYLNFNKIRIFDYPRFAEPLRDQLRDNAEKIAQDNGLQIEFIKKNNFRKDERIEQIVKKRGDHPGMVHIFSCATYKRFQQMSALLFLFYRRSARSLLCARAHLVSLSPANLLQWS